jgi:hypothetical protein
MFRQGTIGLVVEHFAVYLEKCNGIGFVAATALKRKFKGVLDDLIEGKFVGGDAHTESMASFPA